MIKVEEILDWTQAAEFLSYARVLVVINVFHVPLLPCTLGTDHVNNFHSLAHELRLLIFLLIRTH